MTIAYLVNTAPVTSSTFIRREMAALEAQGVVVRRFALRRWHQPLVDPLDVADQARTHYILSGNLRGLLVAALRQAATDPAALARGAWLAARLARSGGGAVRHAAYLLEAVYFLRTLRREGIAHTHVHFSSNAAAVALIARTMGGPTYSFTAHGPDEFLTAAEDGLALKLSGAAFAVAISNFCRLQLVRFGGAHHHDRIAVARCGLDLAEFVPSDRPAGESRTLVCVGRLCPQKGQVYLPAAVAALRATEAPFRLVLIGDGESRPAIEAEIARHGVGDLIELRGWRSGAEVRAAIAESRALVLPSFAEGLPIVLLEALALERPVVTTTVAGIPELVDGGCGRIVPPGDGAALVGALRDILRADEATLARMGRTGRARVARHHDLGTLATTLRGLFAAAIGREGQAEVRTGREVLGREAAGMET
ncbi:colanic acid biosynthesis glycosyltransferase WcaL [Methylobacterium terrae]|uniref:Colanic acid biosynthesis glycosyltransferase WcaL n=1 Tax=Methylobacterium terrae TaxID=2202827 RepID=A0A2U8WID6_9HYPH|nr:glycosyltransferase family 4 protein [Methylobacterium terrae]AWN45271.1 colanic acid biosynthesis glycosyltransferase WcaL [Methylobacterium terrae]